MRVTPWMPLAAALLLVACSNEGQVPTAYICDGEEQLAKGEAKSGEAPQSRQNVTNLPAVLERSFKDKPKFFFIETKLAGPLRGKYCGDSAKGDFIFRPGDCTNYLDLIAFHAEENELIIHLPVQKDRPDEYQASFTCRLKDAPKDAPKPAK